MRVSVVNFCSKAIDMLRFSTEQLIQYAGTEDFDYLVVTWNPSDAVVDYLTQKDILRAKYITNPDYDFVPNLRLMFNHGFEAGYIWNPYVCIVNSDMAFGRNWLSNLMRRTTPDVIPNSLHISPIKGPNIYTADFGVPTYDTFNLSGFWQLHDELYREKVETEEERGGWRATQTMPYIIHEKWWEKCGPWEPTYNGDGPPDHKFFKRVHEAGVKYVLCHDSICYHHEAVERRTSRPVGVETMKEGR